MKKITDPTYQLPEILPNEYLRTMSGGANCPLLVRGVDVVNYAEGDFVLKYRGAERMDHHACRKELLAAWIATELDLKTPEPVVVHVDSAFSALVPSSLQATFANKALGINFGNRFVEAKAIFQPNETLTPELLQSAARVFAFDLLIQNADRRPAKPNSFLANNEIYVIDHELAFGFLLMLPMFANPHPWLLNDVDVGAARQHLFYPLLCQNKRVDWDAALSTLPGLSAEFWKRAHYLMPDEWRDPDELNRVQKHFEALQQYLTVFISEICNKLIG